MDIRIDEINYNTNREIIYESRQGFKRTPEQTVKDGVGNCCDIALLKLKRLKDQGFTDCYIERCWINDLRKPKAHAVCCIELMAPTWIFFGKKRKQTFILDNDKDLIFPKYQSDYFFSRSKSNRFTYEEALAECE